MTEQDDFWLTRLCYYDERNPDSSERDPDLTDEELNNIRKNCYCDNCFYGRTKMAEKHIDELSNQEDNVKQLTDLFECPNMPWLQATKYSFAQGIKQGKKGVL